MIHPKKLFLIGINLLGGFAVLGSYVYGALSIPNASQVLWGGVPPGIRPIYVSNMFLAAAGYLAFTYFILFQLDPIQARVAKRFRFGLFSALYAAILVPSALWLPLTFWAVGQSSPLLRWLVRLDLSIVAVASLGLLSAVWAVKPVRNQGARRIALVGGVFFCLQTVILDAIIWGIRF